MPRGPAAAERGGAGGRRSAGRRLHERARRRRSTPPRLSARLAGRSRRCHRHGPAQGSGRAATPRSRRFAADVRRHLDSPSRARPARPRGRTSRAASSRAIAWAWRRRRWCVLVVGGAAVTFSVQAARLAEERDRTARERDTAQQVLSFLTELFEVSNPRRRPRAGRSRRASCSIAAPNASTRNWRVSRWCRPACSARSARSTAASGSTTGRRRCSNAGSSCAGRRSARDHPDTAASMEELAEAYRELARLRRSRDACTARRWPSSGAPARRRRRWPRRSTTWGSP